MNKKDLLDVALKLAELHGYTNITRDLIAMNAGVAQGTVTNYLGTMKAMRRSLIRHAIAKGNNTVIVQAISHNEPHVMSHMSKAERLDAMVAVV